MKTLITAIALSTIGGISMASSFNSVEQAQRFVTDAEAAIEAWHDCRSENSYNFCNRKSGEVIGTRLAARGIVGNNGKSIPATLEEAKVYIQETVAAEEAAAAAAQAELMATSNADVQKAVTDFYEMYDVFLFEVRDVYMDYLNGGTTAEDALEIIDSLADVAEDM